MINLLTILLETIIFFPMLFSSQPMTYDETTSVLTVRVAGDADSINFISPDGDVYNQRTYEHQGMAEAKYYVNEDGLWSFNSPDGDEYGSVSVEGSNPCSKLHYNGTQYLSKGSCGDFVGIGIGSPENMLNDILYTPIDFVGQAVQVDASSVYMVIFSGDDPYLNPFPLDEHEQKMSEWQNLFTEYAKQGIMVHVVLSEAETNHLLTDQERLEYYDYVAGWFGYLPNVTFIITEEYDNQPSPIEAEIIVTWACQLDLMTDTPIGIHNGSNNVGSVFYHFFFTDCIDFLAVQYYQDDDYASVVTLLHDMSTRGGWIKPVHITEPESFHGLEVFCADANAAIDAGGAEFSFYIGDFDQNLPDITQYYGGC